MKMRPLLLSLIPLIFLSSCTGNDEWKKNWGTPELFLSMIEREDKTYIYLNGDDSNKINDVNFEIKNYLKTVDEYHPYTGKVDTKQGYFTYEYYISPSTAGPNHCDMHVYANGVVVIDYKAALARHKYEYFAITSEKAQQINNFVLYKFHQH